MSYLATYINPLMQFGTVSLDLILHDIDDIMPDKRISKNFSEPEQVEVDFLVEEAIREINKATKEYNEWLNTLV